MGDNCNGGMMEPAANCKSNASVVNEIIVDILKKCGCAGYAHCFRGVNECDFRRMTVHDIISRIKSSLVSIETHPDFLILIGVHAEKINQEIVNFANIQNPNSLSPSSANNSGLAIISPVRNEVTIGSGSNGIPVFVSVAQKPMEIEKVDRKSSRDEEKEKTQKPVTKSPSVSQADSIDQKVSRGPKRSAAIAAAFKCKEIMSNEDFEIVRDQDKSEPKRFKKLFTDGSSDIWDLEAESDTFIQVCDPTFHLKKLARIGPDYAEECSKIRITKNEQKLLFHNSKSNRIEMPNRIQEWTKFFKQFGPTITSIELNSWSWQPVKSYCPYSYDLFKMLTKFCPNLEVLIFKVGLESESSDCGVESQLGERRNNSTTSKSKTVDLKPKKFPKLKKIVVDMKTKERKSYGMVPSSVLRSILNASPNLQVFLYHFASKRDLDVVLRTLGNFDGVWMDKLRCLGIRSVDEDGYLVANQIAKLASLKAKNLQELILGNGLWEDVEGSLLEKLLKNFPLLKKFVIYGNYQGNSLQERNILIEIPPSEHLEHLEMGGNYALTSFIETQQKQNRNMISITVKFPYLPNLHTIILGTLFKIDDLHFCRFPKITSFRVASPWHLALKCRPDALGRNSYPLVKELHIPNCLKDVSFVQNLPKLFPSVEICWIFLPSMRVLRSFFKCMGNSMVNTLFLRTQFDFGYMLETCLLAKPANDSKVYVSCWTNRWKVETLKEYEMWEKWVDYYNVELPCVKKEELEELGDKEVYAGLSALKNLEYFEIEHVQRTLEIPKGKEHWLGPRAEFSIETIGFEKYPLSKKCIEELPWKVLQFEWANFEVQSEVIKDLKAGGLQTYDPSDWNDESKKCKRRRSN